MMKAHTHMVIMFPTPVGLNRHRQKLHRYLEDVPHTSGAEPVAFAEKVRALECSPHQWG